MYNTDILCILEVHNKELVETSLMHPFLCLFLANLLKLFFTKGDSTTKTIAKMDNGFILKNTD